MNDRIRAKEISPLRSLSILCLLILLGSRTLLPGQKPNAPQDSKGVPNLAWETQFVPSVITLFGKPISQEEARVANELAFDSRGKRVGQYELVATCLAGAFHFRVSLRSFEGDPLVQFKQFNLHLNDSANPYGLGSINRDPWTKSEISIDGVAPVTVLSNDMADTGRDYQSSFLFSDKTEQAAGNHLFWGGQKSVLLSAHKLVVTQTLDDDRKVSFSFDPQAKELKDFLMGRCGSTAPSGPVGPQADLDASVAKVRVFLSPQQLEELKTILAEAHSYQSAPYQVTTPRGRRKAPNMEAMASDARKRIRDIQLELNGRCDHGDCKPKDAMFSVMGDLDRFMYGQAMR
jgi:hypothetical protein